MTLWLHATLGEELPWRGLPLSWMMPIGTALKRLEGRMARQLATLAALAVFAGPLIPAAGAADLHGHRGARGLMPENTLPAFQRAIEIGVDILELDTVITADGQVVVMHDRSLKPGIAREGGDWITGPVLVRSLSRAALDAYDVGRLDPNSRGASRFPNQTPVDGTRVPSLREVFDLARERGAKTLRFNIETKISPLAPDETPAPADFARALVAEIRKAGVADRSIVQSFDWRTLVTVQKIAPEIKTAYLTASQRWLDNLEVGRDGASPWLAGADIDNFDGSAARTIKALGGDIWSPFHRELTAEALREARELGLEVHVWTVNKPADIRRMLEMDVDGIISDYPDVARGIMESGG
jgi:glycerophosphoryl diester phosphodiesterase